MSGAALRWSLATQPFIDVVDHAGRHRTVSAGTALAEADVLHLAAPDPLLRAAVARLLVTIAYTAGCAPSSQRAYVRQVAEGLDLEPAVTWTAAHERDLDLFDPQRPLLQDHTLREIAGLPDATVPILYLDMGAAIGRPLLSDRRHLHAATPVSFCRAAQLLLVQQTWALGGRIRALDRHFGPGSNFGTSAAATGSLVWLPSGTIAQMLAWRLMSLPGPLGTPAWTYTPRGGTQRVQVVSELDGMTWHHRRVLLLPEPDGTVARALFAQGWRLGQDLNVPASARIGSRDVLDLPPGPPLPARAIASESDIAPVVDRWWQAPPGSWAHAARHAVTNSGCAPELLAVGLANDNKKLLHQRAVPVPASVLADPRAADAAHSVVRFRRLAARAAPARQPHPEAGTDLPPGFGSDLLHEEAFVAATDPRRDEMLLAAAQPAPGGDPARDGLRSATLAYAVQHTDPPRDHTPDTTASAAAQEASGQQALFALDTQSAPADPSPPAAPSVPGGLHAAEAEADLRAPAVPGLEDLDDGLGFITSDTPLDGLDPFVDDAAADGTDPGRELAIKLGRWATNPRRRPLLTELARWAVRPDPSNRAYPLVTHEISAEHHEAAMLTAALFAVHYTTNRAAPLYGKTDLPRLMRSFGSAGRYGSGHPGTRAALQVIVRTRALQALRPLLLRQIRTAAADGKTPYWPGLFRDLCAWDPALRRRWAQQFFTNLPLPALATPASPARTSDKDLFPS